MDVSMDDNNEEQLPSTSDVVGEIEEHMFNLDELNILGMKEDRSIVSNLMEGVEIESPPESLHTNVTDVQSPSVEGQVLVAEKSAEDDSDNPSLLETVENYEDVSAVLECNLESHEEESVEKSEAVANVDTTTASDEGNSDPLPSIPGDSDELKDDIVEESKNESATEVVGCKSTVVSEVSQCGDEVVEMEQDESFEVIPLDPDKDDEVVALDQNKEKEVLLNEKENADDKETEPMEISENTSVSEEVSGSSVSETVKDVISEEQQNHSNHEQVVTEEDNIQVTKPPLETSRERGRRKRSTSISLLNNTGNSTSAHEDEDLDEGNTGRPRRKAAQIAGNQIKQIVNSEKDLMDVADKRKDTEDWSEEGGPYPRMICFQCCRFRSCQYHLLVNGVSRYMCSTACFQAFRRNHTTKNTTNRKDSELKNSDIPSVEVGNAGERKTSSASGGKSGDKDHALHCAYCDSALDPLLVNDKKLSWETMEFCDEHCLEKYQDQLGSNCSQCKLPVQKASMGKYCVRFGYNIKQFCCSTCLEEFKKGLKSCTYCQKDISSGAEGFLAPVGDKGQFKDFCTPTCMEKYDHISSGTRPPIKINSCAVCNKPRPVFVELLAGRLSKDVVVSKPVTSVYGLCSEPCFAAFKYVNQLKTEQCESCMRQFDTSLPDEKPTTFFYDGGYHICCRACLNVYILTHRRIVQCNWCRVKKYDFDMIKRVTTTGNILMMCSLNCLNLFHVSINAVSSQRNMEQEERRARYAECMRNYRRQQCDKTVKQRGLKFRARQKKIRKNETIEETIERRAAGAEYMRNWRERRRRLTVSLSPIIDDGMQCDHCKETTQAQYHLTMSDATVRSFCTYDCVMAYQSRYSRTPLTLPEDAISVDSGRLISQESGSDVPSVPVISSVQSLAPTDSNAPTDPDIIPTSLISAQPESIYSIETRVSEPINGMAPRQVIVMPPSPKSVRNKMTSCKPTTVSRSVCCQPSLVDSSTQTDEMPPVALVPVPVPIYVPMPMHMYCSPFPIPVPFALPIPVPIVIPSTLAYEEIKKRAQVFESVAPEEAEILMMAELVADEEPKRVEIEADPVEPPSPIEDCENPVQSDVASDSDSEDRWKTVDLEELIVTSSVVGPAYVEEPCEEEAEFGSGTRQKRKATERLKSTKVKQPHNTSQASEDEECIELKAYLGVNAWSTWVQQKNSELSKVTSNSRRLKLFKTDLLHMNLEELNYALCLFVKEVRKPGGEMYAADTIFYFCLGIQHFLAENGRLDNIFTDLYFEKFTECLDQVAMTFPPLTKETSLISTRVSEEHLWESRQLGAHSPYVLLSTLVFFNTKYFHLWTVDDHAKLKFASVVKVLKKGRGRQPTEGIKPGSSGSRATGHSTLRYTHPDSDEKVYEQHENLETPLRCPVKLYEFYLSRCPEPVRRGGDLFYLLPERACVPDSPVWYSSVALGFDALGKILHRIKMVKEICEAYVNDEIPS